MATTGTRQTALLLCAAAAFSIGRADVLFNPKYIDTRLAGGANSTPINITPFFNNQAFGNGIADFDGHSRTFPNDVLPPSTFTYAGVNFSLPIPPAGGMDNVKAQGQGIDVPVGHYQSVYMLAASDADVAVTSIRAQYADEMSSLGEFLVPSWWNWPYPAGGDLIFPYHWDDGAQNYNQSMIYLVQAYVDSTRLLTTLFLPELSNLHVFALSLVSAPYAAGPQLAVQYAATTSQWFEGTNKTQIVEVVVSNVGKEWVLANNSVSVSVKADGLETKIPAEIKRLRPGDQVRLRVGVVNKPHVAVGSTGKAEISIKGKKLVRDPKPYEFMATHGIPDYSATFESVYSHRPAPWFEDAKFGIFSHWGIYSVPAWGNVAPGETKAEWYWWNMNAGPDTNDDTYDYHGDTYGENVAYDDFIQQFNAENFSAKAWVDLYAEAGAQYFVQVAKHHEGYALFDVPANVTERTSVALFPHRNLLKELFDAAKEHQPHLHRATYYSMGEWYNPAYQKYGFGSWPGGNATNPYTEETLPYRGYVAVDDYVADYQLPQMQALADMGTEIMWCDVGGANMSPQFASKWFNDAARAGRQVTLNSRCGIPGDFDTAGYAQSPLTQARKWESNMGMDPSSFGYNQATPLAQYMNAEAIVTTLVDVVSRNGNLLLDVGPTADGRIIDLEQANLRAAGRWIRGHAEAIFNTTYWFVAAADGPDVRFTTTRDAFYVLATAKPAGSVCLDQPVPYVPGDRVTVVGGSRHGAVVPSMLLANGSLLLNVSRSVSDADEYTWVFKIPYEAEEPKTTKKQKQQQQQQHHHHQ